MHKRHPPDRMDSAAVDAAPIAGIFSGLDRVADTTGAPHEISKAADAANMRGAVRIDAYAQSREELEADNIF